MNELCKQDGCEKPVQVQKRGLCRSHYQTWALNNKPRGKKPCGVEHCSRHMYAKGYCSYHYDNLRRYGSPIRTKRADKRAAAPKFCKSVVAGKPCGNEAYGLTGKCKPHYVKDWLESKYGTYSVADFEEEPQTYTNAHYRLRMIRGKASDYKCLICGEQAFEWALSADAKDLRFDHIDSSRETLSAYSPNPYNYFPACRDDHRAYDAQHKNRNYKVQQARWEVSA